MKMALANNGSDPFNVEVSIDTEKTEGFTKRLTINPEDLLRNVRKKQISEKAYKEINSDKEEGENDRQQSG